MPQNTREMSESGKGSGRRKEDSKKFEDGYDKIKWGRRDAETEPGDDNGDK